MECRRAGRLLPHMRARLERAVGSGTVCIPGIPQRGDLGMRVAAAAMPATPDDRPVEDDHAAHGGVRRRPAQAAMCEPQCLVHEKRIAAGWMWIRAEAHCATMSSTSPDAV